MLMENDLELVWCAGMGLATPDGQLACQMHAATRGSTKQETSPEVHCDCNPDLCVFIVASEHTVKVTQQTRVDIIIDSKLSLDL
jgi:hypothetical protein